MKKSWLLFLFLGFFIAGGNIAAQTGVIREISGTVEIKQSGHANFVTAQAGDLLNQDTIISTSFRSFAIIEIGYSSMTVRPLTRLTLVEIQASESEETLNVDLQSGRVRVDVKPPAGVRTNMSVTSTTASASVRGTSFEFDTRNLYVDEGVVNFTGNRGQGITVHAGENSFIDTNSRAASSTDVRARALSPIPLNAGTAAGILRGPSRTGVPFVIELEYK